MESKALTKMTESTMLARVDMAKFPQELTPQDKRLLAKVAITYGFDPLMGEVSIYQGKPYVSIDGRYRAAQETGKLDGIESRPAGKQEREDWKIPDGDYFFRADVYVKGSRLPFVGWGRVFASELVGKGFKPIEKNPQRMAEKRAEAQALRKAFHIPLPSFEEIGSPIEEDTPAVIEAVVEKPPVEATKQASEAIAQPEKPKRDQTIVRTSANLMRYCFQDFKMQPAEVLAELNIKAISELAITPAEAYLRIAAIRNTPKG